MKSSLARLLLAAVLVSCTNLALAQITIPNFSFESDAVNDNSTTTTTPTSWTFTSGGSGFTSRGVHDPNNTQYAGTTGNDAALPGTAAGGQTGYIFVAQGGTTTFGALAQTGLATVASDTDYTLTVALGDRLDVTPASGINIILSITVGGVTKASSTFASTSLTDGTFVDRNVVYSSVAGDVGGSLGISLRLEGDPGSSFFTANFDNVRLVATPVPEPSLYASAAALGLLGWAALRRFKARSASPKA